MQGETKALAKGVYIAMSNANIKKGLGAKPKPGSKKASGGNWKQGGELFVEYETKYKQIREPVTDWIDRLKNKDAVETYTDKTGKSRRRKVSKYHVVRLKSQNAPGVFFERDIYRVGSKGTLPFSWAEKGQKNLANYYFRKQWRYAAEQFAAEVRLSPAKFKGERDNERVLKLIDKGGSGYGSLTLRGFKIIWSERRNGRQNIGIQKIYYREPRTVRFRGFNIKQKVVGRVNKALKKRKPSQILPSQWRIIGSNGY